MGLIYSSDSSENYVKPLIEIYTLQQCPRCIKLKEVLQKKNVEYVELILIKGDDGKKNLEKFKELLPGVNEVPQCFVDKIHIGDADAMEKWLNSYNEKE